MRESSFPLGGHSWERRFRTKESVMIRENVALQRDTQAGGRMGWTAISPPTARRMHTQMGRRYCISGDVLLNSKRVESPNPVSRSESDGTRWVRIDSARDTCIF